MKGHNVCFYGAVKKSSPYNPSYPFLSGACTALRVISVVKDYVAKGSTEIAEVVDL